VSLIALATGDCANTFGFGTSPKFGFETRVFGFELVGLMDPGRDIAEIQKGRAQLYSREQHFASGRSNVSTPRSPPSEYREI